MSYQIIEGAKVVQNDNSGKAVGLLIDGKVYPMGSPYTLPTMSATKKGGAKVGAGLQMDGDTLSVVQPVVIDVYNKTEFTEEELAAVKAQLESLSLEDGSISRPVYLYENDESGLGASHKYIVASVNKTTYGGDVEAFYSIYANSVGVSTMTSYFCELGGADAANSIKRSEWTLTPVTPVTP